MIEKTIKVLILEDMEADCLLAKRQVLKVAPKAIFTIAGSRAEFEKKIQWQIPDIILADYKLPDFTGLDALFYTRKTLPFVPFIFVTGTLNDEEKVAQTILGGASGYLLKQNLSELGSLVENIWQQEQINFKKEEKRLAKLRRREILLQKLEELIEKTPRFPEKGLIQKTLHEIAICLVDD